MLFVLGLSHHAAGPAMRILLLSDVHANPAALAAINEPHDCCICLGDLVEYGPAPAEVIAWARQRVDVCVRGNHDHGLVQDVAITGAGGFRYLTQATRRTSRQLLNIDDLRYLAALPMMRQITLGGRRFLFVHATPRDPLDEYVAADPAAWTARLQGWDVDFVCVGHTHQPFVLELGRRTVVNPGSVGLQRDGDPRARYAIIEPDGRVQLKRVEYDVELIVQAVQQSQFEEKAKGMLADVYRSGKYLHPTPSMANGNGNGHGKENGNGNHKP